MRNNYRFCYIFFCLWYLSLQAPAQLPRQAILFTEDWKFYQGDIPDGESKNLDYRNWRLVSLPQDWSIGGPFSREWASGTEFLPVGIGWYRKSFLNGNPGKLKITISSPGLPSKVIFINSVK